MKILSVHYVDFEGLATYRSVGLRLGATVTKIQYARGSSTVIDVHWSDGEITRIFNPVTIVYKTN